jgi:hypothetical protein
LLAPVDHTGLTASAQPTLYWQLSQPAPYPVEVVVRTESDVRPLVKRQLSAPTRAGVHSIDLSTFEVNLRPDVAYEWSIRLVLDPEHPAGDPVAMGEIRRITLDAVALERLGSVPVHRRVNVFAERGTWYDALDAVSRQIEEHPGDQGPLRQRDSLLEQVGLEPITSH